MCRRILIPLILLSAPAFFAATRPADIAFRVTMIDPGYNETAAVADLNHDGKPDIISGDSWYEAPTWTKHHLRDIDYANGYIDNFSDLPIDVDGDGWTDIVQCSYFAHKIIWLKNPGTSGGPWKETVIDDAGPTEFAFLVDLNNDGKAQEILPEYDNVKVPLAWYELDSTSKSAKWIKHVVADHSFGHGIGVGDVNGDGRNDILTPKGWLEAPADPRAEGYWKFHATDWDQHPIQPAGHHDQAPSSGIVPVAGQARLVSPRGSSFGRMYLLDINSDGRPDLLTTMAHDYGILWYEQTADGQWLQHIIDNTWSQAHAAILADLNGDGQLEFITGKRYFAHNGNDPGEREPIGLYWYEYRKLPASERNAANGGVEWIRHIVDYGNRMGGGMQIVAADMNNDGTLDLVSGGKAGLFLAENLTGKQPK